MVFSADTHVGPRLVEDLRPYCPKMYLEQFDDFASSDTQIRRFVWRCSRPPADSPPSIATGVDAI